MEIEKEASFPTKLVTSVEKTKEREETKEQDKEKKPEKEKKPSKESKKPRKKPVTKNQGNAEKPLGEKQSPQEGDEEINEKPKKKMKANEDGITAPLTKPVSPLVVKAIRETKKNTVEKLPYVRKTSGRAEKGKK